MTADLIELWRRLWGDPLYRLVICVAIAQLSLLFGAIASIVLLRSATHRRRAHERARDAALRGPLFEYLAHERTVESLVAASTSWTFEDISRVLEQYAPSLDGESFERIGLFYRKVGLVDYAKKHATSALWWRRLEAMRMLAVTGGREGTTEMTIALADKHPPVRLAAARGLARTNDENFIQPLLDASRRDHMSRLQIAEVLVSLGEQGLPRLREIVTELPDTEEHSRLRATTLEVLGITGDLAAAPYIRFALESEDLEVRIAAYRAARMLSLDLTTDELRYGLRDDAWQVRAVTAQTAAALNDPGIATELGALISDRNWWVRYNAAWALKSLSAAGVHALEHVVATAEDPFARDMAKHILTSDPTYSALTMGRDY
ncbi:MAG: hypothetical protein ACI81R_002091 [Bradymonadia bacterium]|jgi:hypothetical protein